MKLFSKLKSKSGGDHGVYPAPLSPTKSGAGFTLIELLIYVAILAMVGGLFTGILAVAARFQVTQAVGNEVAQQLNFVTQTIQRLTRESSEVIVSNASPCTSAPDNANDNGTLLGTAQPCLKLRMKDSNAGATDRDPVYIYKDTSTGTIKLSQGRGANFTTQDLTTPKVQNTSNYLTFTKFSNAPGHDIVEINLTLNFAGTNPQSTLARSITTAIGRASAATFDSSLIPGTGGTFDVGQSGTTWKDGFFGGDVTVGGNTTVSGNLIGGNNSGKYLQFKTYAPVGSIPPAGDCQSDNDLGRFYLTKGSSGIFLAKLYVCSYNAASVPTYRWQSVNLSG